MKFSKIKAIIVLLCVVMMATGCGVVQITDENKSSASINPEDPTNRVLFESWSPLTFCGGQTLSYNFEISGGKYTVNGNFILSVQGKNESRLKFDWQFNIGKETDNGSFRGNSADFVKKLKEYCKESSVKSMVYQSIFTTYEGAAMYNSLVANDKPLEIGMTWHTSYQGQKYEHSLLSVDSYGSIDGFSVSSSVNGIPSQVICISPFIPLPSMTMFLTENDSGEPIDIVCELAGAILP